MYHHTVLVPKTLAFKPKYYPCPICSEKLEEHIVCEGARFHVHYYDSKGVHCSTPLCEDNHICKGKKGVNRNG